MLSSTAMLDLSLFKSEKLRPLKRREYDRLIELGIFDEDEKIELLHGLLVEMTPIGPPHCGVAQRLTRLLLPPLLGRAAVRIQQPFAASDDSEPEPDVLVAPEGDYFTEHPSEAYLIIEVADSSLARDRRLKARLYASCGVPEYWVVNLRDRVIECFAEPRDGEYQERWQAAPGDEIAPRAFADVRLAVAEMLPPA